ncbi:hypothetical protein SEUCBS139899_003748 [Sporothrix eucalyptigena]|uniref:ARCA-like protein n=1 Tax=Sporothrix eucalyptigena TaxID=1812306 RepID=A0ABP0BPS4_9PEZI
MEAFLFRYYIDYASRAFDLCDLLRHFALVVPCRALSYAPLLNAIFAVSARQLSRTNADMDPAVADVYYQECLTGLRHMMVDESALMDENLFAATVILRNLEEIDSPMQGDGSGSQNAHLLGNSLFAKATVALHSLARLSDGAGGSPMFTGLRRAAYLVAVREEIYTSFVAQRPISPSFSSLVIDMSLDAQPDDDPDWANRAVFLLADALQFCFGGENDDGGVIGNSRNNIGASDARNGNDTVPASSVYARYDELVDYARRWHQKKPQSFSPLYYYDPLAETSAAGSPLGKKTGMDWAVGLRRKNYTRNPDGFFPEIWLMSDAVCTGMMHYHLARILLLAFDPRAPRVGPKRAPFSEEQGRLIRQEVRVLVGIALSNGDDCYPNYVSACMGIALVGERFESRIERDKILGFLEHTESVCPWTAVTAKEHMSEAWEIGRRSQSRAQCG